MMKEEKEGKKMGEEKQEETMRKGIHQEMR
jgi:hypothetical protein